MYRWIAKVIWSLDFTETEHCKFIKRFCFRLLTLQSS